MTDCLLKEGRLIQTYLVKHKYVKIAENCFETEVHYGQTNLIQ